MQEKTEQLIKKTGQDYNVQIRGTDALTNWVISARVPRSIADGQLQPGKKYMAGPAQNGNVLIMQDPQVSDACTVESWGPMKTIDDFMKKPCPDHCGQDCRDERKGGMLWHQLQLN